MRPSKLCNNAVGTVLHDRPILSDEEQRKVFNENDLPPILKPETPQYDRPTGEFKERVYTVPELKSKLEEAGINPDGSRTTLLKKSATAGIPVKCRQERYCTRLRRKTQRCFSDRLRTWFLWT
jgi:hypothetical protein